jgi:hypothetical protein
LNAPRAYLPFRALANNSRVWVSGITGSRLSAAPGKASVGMTPFCRGGAVLLEIPSRLFSGLWGRGHDENRSAFSAGGFARLTFAGAGISGI